VISRRRLRGIVRDYILDAHEETPDISADELKAEVRERLQEDFKASPWLKVLLQLLQVLLPILIVLMKDKPK